LQMILGDIDTLKASIYPSNISDSINWKSSDESIATVTQEGIVTAIAKGEAIITVMTGKDSIANTAKVVVNTDGDKDGIIDENDTCADTPEGATVDTNGCADSQKDTDSDGVKDDKDTCADTAEGAEVDENGCVITIDDSSSSTFNINVTANSSSNYSLAGTDRNGDVSGNDPELTFKVGDVINFSVNASGHPFYLKTTAGTGVDNGISGVTNNGTTDDTASWTPTTAGTYYYQCSLHGGMVGTIIIE